MNSILALSASKKYTDEIVWFGDINFLSSAKEGETSMRLKSKEAAQELMEAVFTKIKF